MKDLIPRKKATIKIEISKNSKKKVSVKVSHYSNATSEMEDEERKQYLLSEGFDCQNEPIFLINLKSKIADFLQANPEKNIKDITIACYGLAFKPDIDDLRESPALAITKKLAEQGFNILAIEPNIQELPVNLPENIKLISLDDKDSADIHLILVDHKEFKEKNLKFEYLLDTKGIWA